MDGLRERAEKKNVPGTSIEQIPGPSPGLVVRKKKKGKCVIWGCKGV